MSASDEFIDPLEAHARRDPLPGAGVSVLVLTTGNLADAEPVARGLERLIAGYGRAVESRVVDVSQGWGPALEECLNGSTYPLVLVTTAAEPWAREHLGPLLKSIDKCDHVNGRRPLDRAGRVGRWLRALGPRLVFGIPVLDVHSPCRLHRREPLARIPLQSRSAFLDVEILAKATFFGHLLDEVDVPSLPVRVPARLLARLSRGLQPPHVRPGPCSGVRGSRRAGSIV